MIFIHEIKNSQHIQDFSLSVFRAGAENRSPTHVPLFTHNMPLSAASPCFYSF
jgi:hypothetical protein